MWSGRIGAAVALAVGLVAAGCGGDGLADVSGAVTVDGSPPATGSITFTPADGKGVTAGGDIKDGRYAVRASPGVMKVAIRVSKVTGKRKLYNTPDSPTQDVHEEVLAAKYNEKTELTFEVKAGSNTKDWALESKPAKGK
jgi:hypothetical protein